MINPVPIASLSWVALLLLAPHAQEAPQEREFQPSQDADEAYRVLEEVLSGRRAYPSSKYFSGRTALSDAVRANRRFLFTVGHARISDLILKKSQGFDLDLSPQAKGTRRLVQAFGALSDANDLEGKQARSLAARLDLVFRMTREEAVKYIDAWTGLVGACERSGPDAEQEAERRLRALVDSGDLFAMAAALDALARRDEGLGRWAGALDRFEKDLEVARLLGHPTAEAEIRAILAKLCSRLGRHDEALRHADAALAAARKTGRPELEATARWVAGACKFRAGRMEEALKEFEAELAIEREFGVRIDALVTADLGATLLALGRTEEAARRLDEAMAGAESARREVGTDEELKQRILRTRRWIYERALESQIRSGRMDRAFDVIERMRSRSLLDALGSTAPFARDVPSELLEARGQAVAKSNTDRRRLETLLSTLPDARDPKKTREQIDELRQALKDSDDYLQLIEREIRNHQPVEDVAPLGAAEVGRGLARGEALVLYTFVRAYDPLGSHSADETPDRLVAAVVTCASLEIMELKWGAEAVGAVLWFREAAAQSARGYPPAKFKIRACRLYDALVRPLESRFAGLSRLYVAPDEQLYTVPLEALVTSNRGDRYSEFDYLGGRLEIAYVPSGTLLAKRRFLASRADAKLVAFGDPDYGSLTRGPERGSPDRGAVPEDLQPFLEGRDGRGGWASLPFSGVEAGEVAKLMEGKAHLGADAGERRAKRVEDAHILHFACHGYLDARPRFSALILAADEGNDGYLEAREIAGMRLKAELVVLSACDSGRGEVLPGEGLLGLTRAFMLAGARRVVASLWTVSDQGGKDFMVGYYRGLAAGKDKLSALFETKREFMRHAKYSAPYYWAGLVLHGG